MDKKLLKRMGVLFLALSITLSLVACGGNNNEVNVDNQEESSQNTEENAAEEQTDENVDSQEESSQNTEENASGEQTVDKSPITLQIMGFYGTAVASGVQSTLVAEEIKEATGVTMDVITDTGEHTKLKLALASGDLADIVLVPNSNYIRQIVDGKLALPLNDLLQTHGKNIMDNMQTGLDTINHVGNITDGNYYFLPNNVNTNPSQVLQYRPWIGFEMRWDYYKELGYPEIKTEDDFIDVLAQMQKNHPETSDGKNVYGLAAFADWGTWGYYVPYMYSAGYLEVTNGVYDVNNDVVYRYGENGPFWKAIEFLYKANKAGVLDPDSFTMKYDNYVDKAKNGQLLTIGFDWIANDVNATIQEKEGENKGFQSIPSKAFNTAWTYTSSKSQAGYWGNYAMISKNCENPERAMDFLDYTHSYEGSRLLYSGVKGEQWDIVNGKAELKDETFKQIREDANFSNTTGIALDDLSFYSALSGYGMFAIDPDDGGMMSLSRERKGLLLNITPFDREFSQHYDAEFPGDVWDKMVEDGTCRVPTANNLITAFAIDTDEGKKMHTNIEEYLKKNLAKCILAKSDEDFEEQVRIQIEELKKLGLEDMTEYVQKQIADAKTAYDKIIK